MLYMGVTMTEDLTPEDIKGYLKEEEEEEIAERIVTRRGRPPRKNHHLKSPRTLRRLLRRSLVQKYLN
jgi:hypothetical protein